VLRPNYHAEPGRRENGMNRNLITLILAVFLQFALALPARGDFKESDWQYFKEVNAPERVESEYAYFQADGDIYDGCATGLSSLRIVDSGFREIPYEIVAKQESERRQELFPKMLNNSYIPGKHNSFVLDIGDDRPRVNEIQILTKSKNFTRLATVEGSENQIDWSLLVKEAYVFDFTRNIESRYLRIEFPLSNFRYLRVKVFDDESGPLEITGAKLFEVTKEEAQTEDWPLAIAERTENQEKKTTEIVLDPKYQGIPIREIELLVESRNYHRTVEAQSSVDREKWVPIGSGIIYNYDLPSFKKTNNHSSVNENVTARYFKLSVSNYDDQPLRISGAVGRSLVRRVILPVTPDMPYRAYFASPDSQAPVYDLAHHIPYIKTERLPRLNLSARQLNPKYVEEKPVRPWSEEHAWLLWAIMGAIILFLAALIFNLMRKTPPEKQQE
jgi:hypothetical protein